MMRKIFGPKQEEVTENRENMTTKVSKFVILTNMSF
jgi:hypothetical protein